MFTERFHGSRLMLHFPLLAVFVISLKWNMVCYCGEACMNFI